MVESENGQNDSNDIKNAISNYFESAQVKEEDRQKLSDKIYGAIDYIDKIDLGDDSASYKAQLAAIEHKNNQDIKDVLVNVYGGKETVYGNPQNPDTNTKSEVTTPQNNQKQENITKEEVERIVAAAQDKAHAQQLIDNASNNYNTADKARFVDLVQTLIAGGKKYDEAISIASVAVPSDKESIPSFAGINTTATKKETPKLEIKTEEEKRLVEMFMQKGVSKDKLLS